MILLTLIAGIAALVLITNAMGALGRVSPADRSRPGGWDLVENTRRRRRSLDAQARRWQTTLTAAQTDEARWADIEREITAIEERAGLAAGNPAIADSVSDLRSLNDRLARLEALADPAGSAGDAPAPSTNDEGTAAA